MRTPAQRRRAALAVETLETRVLLSTAPAPAGVVWQQRFDHTAVGALPAGWSQWGSRGAFAASAATGTDETPGLEASGDQGQAARAWVGATQPADVRATADVCVNSAVPGQVFVRGSNLDTTAPTYYALSLTRGLDVQLLRSVGGATRSLARVQSRGYVSNRWLTVSLRANGTTLQAFVRRQDTGQYLTPHGQWQASTIAALTVTDSAIRRGGLVGLARPAGAAGNVAFDNFTVTRADSSSSLVRQNFYRTSDGSLPNGWSQWNSEGAFRVSTGRARSGSHALTGTTAGGASALAWASARAPADAQVGAAAFLNSLTPAEVFLRGSGLDTGAPSYYALAVTGGMDVQLLRVSRGSAASLGEVLSNNSLTSQWVQVTLRVSGSNLQAVVERLDKHQYLNGDGNWQASPAAALTVTDSALRGAGLAGIGTGSASGGSVSFDDVTVSRPTAAAPPGIALTGLADGALVSHATTVQARVSNVRHLDRVEFYLDGALQATDTTAPFTWKLDPGLVDDGSHTLTAIVYDQGGASASTSLNVNTRSSVSGPQIPRHYSHIRIAELAYSGTVLGPFEQQLLRNSVDLIIPNTNLLPDLNAVVPNTPQLIYTNLSSLYQDLLTDWLNWADAHHVAREAAFYHVAVPTRFSGHSSAAVPVSWFSAVYEGGDQSSFTDLTWPAHSSGRSVSFGGSGTSLYVAYPDQFREINISLATGARAGWSSVLEYPTAVDGDGVPTAWAPLKTISDGTRGLARSGRITFDPPADWVTASVSGSARMSYVRVRTVSDGTAPVANTITGRDYTNSHGGWSGTVPTFDHSADKDRDGYLNGAEYAHRHAGMNARFVYETRLFGVYGPMRPAANPSDPAFRQWAADYDVRLLRAQPLADGLFVDNSSGKPPTDGDSVLESVDTYATDYGAMLNAIGRAIAPRWIMANTSGGQSVADGVISQNTGYFEEFALRPLSQGWEQFEDLANTVAHRAALRNPSPYAVLDSLPTGGSPTDGRTQIATLAEYYLLADPKNTFLDFYGGFEPATSWTRHWSPAVTYNVGQPTGAYSLLATGADPANHALTYRVYQRTYGNALVLYKPLSYTPGTSTPGTTADATATWLPLKGTYRPLRADGTLGSPVTGVLLRNGEGAILVKA